jgi:TonB family protein
MAVLKFALGLSLGFFDRAQNACRGFWNGRSWLLVVGLLLLPGASFGQGVEAKGQLVAQGSRGFSPIFPYDALIAGKTGYAQVTFTVDYSGRAMLLNVDSATDKNFAQAFSADIEAVEFITPRRNGHPLMSQVHERYEFSKPVLDAVAQEILNELRKPEPKLLSESDLDAKPQPIRQPQPAYPSALRGDEESGKAEIEFIIDRTGRVLFPRIVSATHDDFGWAAATAVVRWKYKPPMKNGAAVDVRVRDTVVFDIKKANGMW